MNPKILTLLALTFLLAPSLSWSMGRNRPVVEPIQEPNNLTHIKITILNRDETTMAEGFIDPLIDISDERPKVLNTTQKFIENFNKSLEAKDQVNLKLSDDGQMVMSFRGLEAQTITKDNGDILYYGWCVKVNQSQLQVSAAAVPLNPFTRTITWYYGSELYDGASKVMTIGCKTDHQRERDDHRRDFSELPSSVPAPESIMFSKPRP